ncbi:MAG TPA: hypothetical protein VEG60_26210, partial [Candidatus Binatia bacterium]|nr:hypothetical protein [Candidatus Binatia bacterium]
MISSGWRGMKARVFNRLLDLQNCYPRNNNAEKTIIPADETNPGSLGFGRGLFFLWPGKLIVEHVSIPDNSSKAVFAKVRKCRAIFPSLSNSLREASTAHPDVGVFSRLTRQLQSLMERLSWHQSCALYCNLCVEVAHEPGKIVQENCCDGFSGRYRSGSGEPDAFQTYWL